MNKGIALGSVLRAAFYTVPLRDQLALEVH
jgi:hypothetical protein